MTQVEKGEKVTVNEQQLIQMAQKEESALNNRQEMLQKLSHMLGETITAKEILNSAQSNKGKIMFNIGATVLIEGQITNTEKCKRALSENSYKEDSFENTIVWLTSKEEQIKQQMSKLQAEQAQGQNKLTTYIGVLKQIDAEKKNRMQIKKQSPPTLSR
jgi:prefoldin subunit 5